MPPRTDTTHCPNVLPFSSATPSRQRPAHVHAAPPPREVPEAVLLRDSLLAAAAALPLPPNFLDELIHELGGPNQVRPLFP